MNIETKTNKSRANFFLSRSVGKFFRHKRKYYRIITAKIATIGSEPDMAIMSFGIEPITETEALVDLRRVYGMKKELIAAMEGGIK